MSSFLGFLLLFKIMVEAICTKAFMAKWKTKYWWLNVEFIFAMDNKNKIDYSKKIHLKSKSGDIDLTFTPLFNRHDHINLLIIESNQNQVFGRFNGKIKANNQEFEFNNYLGFLEKVINKY